MNAIYTFISPGIDVTTGEVLYVDRNGRVSSTVDMLAKVKVGNGVPKVNGRFSTSFRYKSFSLTTGFELRLGGQKLNQTLLSKVENAYVENNVDKRVLSERWEKPGDITRYKGLNNKGTRKQIIVLSRMNRLLSGEILISNTISRDGFVNI